MVPERLKLSFGRAVTQDYPVYFTRDNTRILVTLYAYLKYRHFWVCVSTPFDKLSETLHRKGAIVNFRFSINIYSIRTVSEY